MENYWNNLINRLNIPVFQSMQLFIIICGCYQAPGRYYHNLDHIRTCLSMLTLMEGVENREATELAIWFHDIVYIPGCQYNEEVSAASANCFLQQLGCGQLSNDVYNLILSTKHCADISAAGQPVNYLVADIDLAILGAAEDQFRDFEKKIRREYGFLTEQQYKRERCSILQKFLQRSYIYYTHLFRDLYEHQARRNIHKLINYLIRD